MNYGDWSKSFAIFAQYQDSGMINIDAFHVYACTLHPVDMSFEDTQTLVDLGWRWDDSFECWRHEN